MRMVGLVGDVPVWDGGAGLRPDCTAVLGGMARWGFERVAGVGLEILLFKDTVVIVVE